MRFYTDPKGEAYERLIDYVIDRTDQFVLSEMVPPTGNRKRYVELMRKLEPFLLEQCSMEEIQRKSGSNYSEGTYYIYRCCEETGSVLKEAVNGLYDWLQPNMPEDLCFWDANGADFLYTIAHEEMCGILTEIPDRICELKQLKYLEIFEQDIIRLPPALFELTTLETLRIMTADLECIPKEIANLQQLRNLTIYCGSSDRPLSGWTPTAKSDLLLNRIPPELGLLKRLEYLNISYTGIEELPSELGNLTMLQYLNVSNSLIKTIPAFVSCMPNLKNVNVSNNLTG